MKHSKALNTVIITFAVFAAIIIFVVGSVLDSKYHLQLTEYDLSFKNLPESFEGTKIVHLTDLHNMSFGENNIRLAKLIIQQQPDIIAITGDVAGDSGAMDNVEALLMGIQGVAPIYYVTGNHEWADNCVDDIAELMERYGATYLDNQIELLYKGEDSIAVIGAMDRNGPADALSPWELSLQAGELYSDKFKLWLVHRNDYITEYNDIGTDLIVCGHAHGGIIRLPIIGGLLDVHHTFGAKYDSGIYYSDNYIMEVSRGLGNSITIPRLFNRPELVSITLHRQA
jgi:hypothetical protein